MLRDVTCPRPYIEHRRRARSTIERDCELPQHGTRPTEIRVGSFDIAQRTEPGRIVDRGIVEELHAMNAREQATQRRHQRFVSLVSRLSRGVASGTRGHRSRGRR